MAEKTTLGTYVKEYAKEAIGLPPKESRDIAGHPIKTAVHFTKAILFPTVTSYSDQLTRHGVSTETKIYEGNSVKGFFRSLADEYVPGKLLASGVAALFDVVVVDATVLTGPALWPIKAAANAIAPALGRGLARLTHGPLPEASRETATAAEPVPTRKTKPARVRTTAPHRV